MGPGTTVVETGKLRYDLVVHRLTAQSANQAALVGRAKDLLGVAGISATVSGALLNDKLLATDPKEPVSGEVLLLAAVALVLVIVPGILAMRPRRWAFSFDPAEFTARVRPPNEVESQNDLYHYLANTYTDATAEPEAWRWRTSRTGSAITALEQNDRRIRFLGRLVTIQAVGIGLLALSGGLLVNNTI